MGTAPRIVLVFDAPIRVFHWLIVVLVAAAYATWRLNWMVWHGWVGDAVLALSLFRLLWGFFGGETVRFSRFLASPRTAVQHLRYALRRESDRQVGHNPAGGWMVLLLLALLLAETLTGLYVANDIANEGPLTEVVPAWAANAIASSRDPLGCAAGGHRATCSGDRGVCGDQGAEPVAPDDHGNKGLACKRRRAADRQSGAGGPTVARLHRRHSLPG
jgi:cytochrome b